MMSLVAYGSSGESDNESEGETESVIDERKIPGGKKATANSASVTSDHGVKTSPEDQYSAQPSSKSKGDLHSKLPPPRTALTDVSDITSEETLQLSSKLPAPKLHAVHSLLGSSMFPSLETKNRKRKGTVKIMIPSLSDVCLFNHSF